MYTLIESIRPHFFSLREIGENVSLDIKIPNTWVFENMNRTNDDVPFSIKIQDKKEKTTLISLISTATETGYDVVFNYASIIIKTNNEEEEKNKLFSQRVEELKQLFLNSSLDKLKDISFKDLETDVVPNSKRNREIEIGSKEKSGSN